MTAAGGLGMLGGALTGVEALSEALQEVRRRASGRVGVNFVEPFFDREAHRSVLETAAEHGDLVEQGLEAGGHVRGTRALLPLLADTLEQVTVPVVAAGGISSPRAMAAVLAAGAGGARLGTRFVASVESDFHDRYEEALVAADGPDTVYTDRFGELWPGAPHRVLRSAIEAAEAAAPAAVVGEMSAGEERIQVPRFAGFAPSRTRPAPWRRWRSLPARGSESSARSFPPARSCAASPPRRRACSREPVTDTTQQTGARC